ncbi:UNVERIFIED_CONTAM: hypothetical protein Sradi_3584400 [Sesamum radiatum]|uniref:Uncharacterized protein n=1 Tax=Sesamum radiatum TaxID=300843 RepID=A0AAW2QGM6_SESRA
MVSTLTLNSSDDPEASRQPLLTSPAIPVADEPPQSPLIDLPLGPSSALPGTSTVGGSFTPSLAHRSFHKHLQHFERCFPLLHRLSDFRPLHATMELLQTNPRILEEFLVRGVKDRPMQNIFNRYATSWLSKTFSKARVAGKQPN